MSSIQPDINTLLFADAPANPGGRIIVPVTNSFPAEIRTAFIDIIQADDYIAKDRLPPWKWSRCQVFLDNPSIRLTNQTDANCKNFALTRYELIQNRLHRQADIRHLSPRYAVPDDKVFDIIKKEHLKLGHARRDKTYKEIDSLYHGILLKEVA
jgi:hypothetical protein